MKKDTQLANKRLGQQYEEQTELKKPRLDLKEYKVNQPEDDFKDGPGEVAPKADVAEAERLHDLVQVFHVLPAR